MNKDELWETISNAFYHSPDFQQFFYGFMKTELLNLDEETLAGLAKTANMFMED